MTCGDPVYTHTLGETNEDLEVQINLDGVEADLTGAVVQLELRNRRTWESTVFTMIAVDASGGDFRYPWVLGEPSSPGDYDARYRIVLAGGALALSPTNDWLHYRFLP